MLPASCLKAEMMNLIINFNNRFRDQGSPTTLVSKAFLSAARSMTYHHEVERPRLDPEHSAADA
jgi:hypothetical protein